MATNTIVLAIIAMGVIALADVSIKQSAGKISSSLGTLIYAVTAIVIPLVWTLWARQTSGLQVSNEGIFWSIATGVWFSIFTGLMFVIFSQGVDLSIGSPVVRMGGIVLAATLGIIVFREGINLQYLIGFILAAVGIFLVVTR